MDRIRIGFHSNCMCYETRLYNERQILYNTGKPILQCSKTEYFDEDGHLLLTTYHVEERLTIHEQNNFLNQILTSSS